MHLILTTPWILQTDTGATLISYYLYPFKRCLKKTYTIISVIAYIKYLLQIINYILPPEYVWLHGHYLRNLRNYCLFELVLQQVLIEVSKYIKSCKRIYFLCPFIGLYCHCFLLYSSVEKLIPLRSNPCITIW